jgi:hypothetical protein
MPGKLTKLILSLIAGLIQSIVQGAWQVGMKVSIEELAKGQGLSALQNRICPRNDLGKVAGTCMLSVR